MIMIIIIIIEALEKQAGLREPDFSLRNMFNFLSSLLWLFLRNNAESALESEF